MKSFRRKVQHGQELGRTIGFPTLNLRVGHFGEHVGHGVYQCTVWLGGKPYSGLLYFGPGLYKGLTLEIHVIGFSSAVYGQWVSFCVGAKIRDPQKFTGPRELKRQLERDLNFR